MKLLKLVLGICCLGLFLPACKESSLYPTYPDKNPNSGGNQRLTVDKTLGKEWHLQSFGGLGDMLIPVTDGRTYTITFTDKTSFKGQADCNTIGGYYDAGANYEIHFRDVYSTEAFCGDESMDKDFLEGLRSAVSYTITDTTLQIVYDGGRTLNFAPWKPDNSGQRVKLPAILGMQWQLDTMVISKDGGITFEPCELPADQMFTLKFDDLTHLSGAVNCNQYIGIYSYSSGTSNITDISDLASTKANCGIQGSLAENYLRTLQTARRYDIVMGYSTQLTLYDAVGNFRMRFHLRLLPVELDFNTLKEHIGTRYVLAEYGPVIGQRTPVLIQGPPLPSLTVLSDAQISGTGFCAPFSCDYTTAAGGDMTVMNWSGTPIGDPYCIDKDQGLFIALQSASSYTISDDSLQIYFDNKANVLVYVKE